MSFRIATMKVGYVAFLFCFSLTAAIEERDHYVCNSFLDYYFFRTSNPQCRYNPDVGDTPVRN